MLTIFDIITEWLLVLTAIFTCLFSISSASPRLMLIFGKLLPNFQFFLFANTASLRVGLFNSYETLKKVTKKVTLVLELASHFQLQYMLLNLCTLILLWFNYSTQAWWLVSLAGILINMTELAEWYLPQTKFKKDKTFNLRILQFNILHNNKEYVKAIARVMEVQSDIAIFLEISNTWTKELEVLETCFPYHFKIQDRDNYGSGAVIYSKLPLEETSILALAGGRKSLVSRINVEGMPVLIIATHLSNPARKHGFDRRNKQLAKLGNYVANAKDAVIVAGDFNTTMWSPYYKRFSQHTGLRNARSGFGIMPTWPVRSPLFYIPIDHCLVSREIQIIKSRTGRAMGSDHLPLITDLAIAAKTDRVEN